jgi:MFS transporter, ACS family, D-galactonate transporter
MPEISNRRRWALVGLLFIATFINYLDRATLSVALPMISLDLSLNQASKGVLLSAFFWSYALMQIPMGWLVDRLSLRWLYAAFFALWSVACALTGFAGTFVMLIMLRMLLGIGEAVYAPGSLKFISEAFSSQERGLPTGLFDCGSRAGLAVGAVLIGWLVIKAGWRHMFMLVGAAALLWIIPWLFAFPPGFGADRRSRLSSPIRKDLIGRVTFNRNLLGLSLGYLCFGYYGYLLLTWLPDYLMQVRRLTLLRAAVFTALPFLVWALSEPAGGLVADWMIKRGIDPTHARKAVITVALMSGLLLIPAMYVDRATTALVLLCGSCLVGFGSANILVLVQACAPPEEVGIWTGIGNFAGNIGGVLSPLITGLLISRTRSYFAAFALAPIVLLAGLSCYVFVVGKLEPPALHEL